MRPFTQAFGRAATAAYALVAYLGFVLAALWAIGFLADARVPTTVDGETSRKAVPALLIDAGLLLIFAIQHSVMARAWFKRILARLVPASAERSTYVLMSSLVLGLLFWQWQPLPASVWRVDTQPWASLFWAIYALGWLIAVASTFMIDHLDFLGIRQARWRGPRPYEPPTFKERWLYAWVRHPMMLGLLIAFWATPRMTVGHLVFAAASTAYIAVGIRFEERDLRRHLGPVYRDYSDRVPALVPSPQRTRPNNARETETVRATARG